MLISARQLREEMIRYGNSPEQVDRACYGYEVTEARNMNMLLQEKITPRVHQYISARIGTPQEARNIEECIAPIEHYLVSVSRQKGQGGPRHQRYGSG